MPIIRQRAIVYNTPAKASLTDVNRSELTARGIALKANALDYEYPPQVGTRWTLNTSWGMDLGFVAAVGAAGISRGSINHEHVSSQPATGLSGTPRCIGLAPTKARLVFPHDGQVVDGIAASGECTIRFWIHVYKLGTVQTVIAKGDYPGGAAASEPLFAVQVTAGGAVRAEFRDSSGNARVGTSTATLTAGAWHHVQVEADEATNNVRIYIDGVEDGAVSDSGTLAFNASNAHGVWIGAWQNAGDDYYERCRCALAYIEVKSNLEQGGGNFTPPNPTVADADTVFFFQPTVSDRPVRDASDDGRHFGVMGATALASGSAGQNILRLNGAANSGMSLYNFGEYDSLAWRISARFIPRAIPGAGRAVILSIGDTAEETAGYNNKVLVALKPSGVLSLSLEKNDGTDVYNADIPLGISVGSPVDLSLAVVNNAMVLKLYMLGAFFVLYASDIPSTATKGTVTVGMASDGSDPLNADIEGMIYCNACPDLAQNFNWQGFSRNWVTVEGAAIVGSPKIIHGYRTLVVHTFGSDTEIDVSGIETSQNGSDELRAVFRQRSNDGFDAHTGDAEVRVEYRSDATDGAWTVGVDWTEVVADDVLEIMGATLEYDGETGFQALGFPRFE